MTDFDCACRSGWVMPPTDSAWPQVCPVCNGRTKISSYRLGRAVGVSGAALVRLDEMRMRASTAERVFAPLVRLAKLEAHVLYAVQNKKPLVMSPAMKRTADMFKVGGANGSGGEENAGVDDDGPKGR